MRTLGLFLTIYLVAPATAQDQQAQQTLNTGVRIFNGLNEERVENANVLSQGNPIKSIPTEPRSAGDAMAIDGAFQGVRREA